MVLWSAGCATSKKTFGIFCAWPLDFLFDSFLLGRCFRRWRRGTFLGQEKAGCGTTNYENGCYACNEGGGFFLFRCGCRGSVRIHDDGLLQIQVFEDGGGIVQIILFQFHGIGEGLEIWEPVIWIFFQCLGDCVA